MFMLPMILLGIGFAITVAPLTTAVMNGVAQRQIGIASGINNAVASIASLLFVAVLGTIALSSFGRSLDHHLMETAPSGEIQVALESSRDALAPPKLPNNMSAEDRNTTRRVATESFVETMRLIMYIAAALTWCGAVAAAVAVGPPRPRPTPILNVITKPS
jgi:hypothetical protein